VLKPGGRLAASDIALKQPLPDELLHDLSAYVGCIAGAILIEAYRDGLREAGLTHVDVVDTGADLNAYGLVEGQAGCCSPGTSGDCSPGLHQQLAAVLRRFNPNEYAASVRVFALKPGRTE
jgi:hypothetical protein